MDTITSITKKDFLEMIHRDDVEWKLHTVNHVARCKHEVVPPAYYAIIVYIEDGMIEKYLWNPGRDEWQLKNVEMWFE